MDGNSDKSDSVVIDALLDCESDSFDPLKSLYSDRVVVPVPTARCFDNLSMYESAARRFGDQSVSLGEAARRAIDSSRRRSVDDAARHADIAERNRKRFEKYDLEPLEREQQEYDNRNMLEKMPTFEGPLSLLWKSVKDRIRVKVVTRRAHEVRGTIVGMLVAFDKNWNLAMADALESWRRKIPNKSKVPAGCEDTKVAEGSASQKVSVPIVNVLKTVNKVQHCERHLPQIFVRGEHVVTITLLN